MRFWQSAVQLLPYDLRGRRPMNSTWEPDAAHQCEMAIQLIDQGRYSEALIELRRVLNSDKSCAEAHYNLGLVHERMHDARKAVKHYEDAIRLDPKLFAALNQLGVIYGKLGRTVDAVKTFIQAIRVKSDYVAAYGNLAMQYFNGGRYAEATNTCKRALKIDTSFAYAHYILGLVHIDQHSEESALNEYQILRRLDQQLGSDLRLAIDKEFHRTAK